MLAIHKKRDLTPFYLLLITLLVHGVSLFNRGIYWDGALLYGFYQENNLAQLHLIAFSMGLPIYYYIHKMLWWCHYGFICNVIGVSAIYLVAFFSYHSARLFQSIPKTTALLISLFVVVFPGSEITFYHAVTPYYVLYALFGMAFYLGLRWERLSSHRLLLRISSLTLFFLSFSLKSLLVYYLLYMVCAYILFSKENWKRYFNFSNAAKFLSKRLDFFLLPIVFWCLSAAFFKPSGDYADYNSFHALSALKFLYYLIFSVEVNSFKIIWMPLSIFFLAYFLIKWGKKNSLSLKNTIQYRSYLPLVLLGSLAFLLVLLPYLLVGKIPIHDTFPESRFILLLPSASALMLSGMIGLFFADKAGNLHFLGKLCVTIFCLFYLIFWANSYLRLEGESAFKKSIILQLTQHQEGRKYSIYWIDTKDFHHHLTLAPYEWAFMLNEAYTGHARIGFSEISPEKLQMFSVDSPKMQYEKERYNIRNFNSSGYQASMRISLKNRNIHSPWDNFYFNKVKPKKLSYLLNPGFETLTFIKAGFAHLYYRLIKPQELNYFLNSLVSIEIFPYEVKNNGL